jgi:hypothetical protein
MSRSVAQQLHDALLGIDRPGTFCVSGSVPAVLPDLEVKGLGAIGLPLTAKQVKELKQHCEQAPYGKGEETIVDTSVRRVWRLTPEHFSLTNPEWQPFVQEFVLGKVQEELGLEEQKLQAHLYDLLLYEKGSFFLPHRDGEKLDRMVATLVIVLPSAFEGGELVVRHEGEAKVIDFGGSESKVFHIHFAAFYADCEHEIRSLRKGHRLCLVYNLTLGRSKKKRITAPHTAEHVEEISELLGNWAQDESAGKLVFTLDHQYTKDGLVWDALKGVDRARAQVLVEAAQKADCHVYLALLTYWQCGSAEDGEYGYGYGYRRRGGWYDDEDEDEEEEEAGDYEMGEILDSSLTAEHFIDSEGRPLEIEELPVKEEELLDPDELESVEPEEHFEGYTGNAGMTLDRWYRHAALLIWSNRQHFAILCQAGSERAVPILKQMVSRLRKTRGEAAATLKAQCITFANLIMARWPEHHFARRLGDKSDKPTLLPALRTLDDPKLIGAFLSQVLTKDNSISLGKSLPAICEKHGWATFQLELAALVDQTADRTLPRNVEFFEQLCLAKPRKKPGWLELCQALGPKIIAAVESVDRSSRVSEYHRQSEDKMRANVLARLTRALFSTEQIDLLSQLVSHALASPKLYALTSVHVAALEELRPWLKKSVKKPCAPLSRWIAACHEQLETLTAEEPQEPTDNRRAADISCKCADCAELKQFLADPVEKVHRFKVREDRRAHLSSKVREHHLDLALKTDRSGSTYSLVCTKNNASYRASLKKYHQDTEHLAMLRSIQASLPK